MLFVLQIIVVSLKVLKQQMWCSGCRQIEKWFHLSPKAGPSLVFTSAVWRTADWG